MRTFVIDPSESGITGEMLAAAALDLAGPSDALDLFSGVLSGSRFCTGCTVTYAPSGAAGTGGRVQIAAGETGGASPEDLAEEAARLSSGLGLSDKAAGIVQRAVEDLLAADPCAGFGAIAGIILPLMLLDRAGVLRCAVSSLPPAAGVPVSAVVEIFARHRIALSGSSMHRPCTTPAGAALLAHLAEVTDLVPGMTPRGVFHGGDSRGNVLRIIEGTTDDLVEERIVLLETTVDDVTAEVMSYAQRRLIGEGAVDVTIIPALGKKGRPAHVLTVITTRRLYRHLTLVLMEETGTLGVRIYEVPRLVADRRREPVSIEIGGSVFAIRVKYSGVGGRQIAVKPEYEDMKAAAHETGLSLKTVADIVQHQITERGLMVGE